MAGLFLSETLQRKHKGMGRRRRKRRRRSRKSKQGRKNGHQQSREISKQKGRQLLGSEDKTVKWKPYCPHHVPPYSLSLSPTALLSRVLLTWTPCVDGSVSPNILGPQGNGAETELWKANATVIHVCAGNDGRYLAYPIRMKHCRANPRSPVDISQQWQGRCRCASHTMLEYSRQEPDLHED